MTGLIQKDICLLLQRSRYLVLMAVLCVIIGLSADGTFVIGYLTMISTIMTIGTISYDEFDNGYPFLMTLPITRKTYVTAKYLFCFLGDLAGWLLSVIIFYACSLIRGDIPSASALMETTAFIMVFCVMLVIMLPVQLKYGTEKSRVAIIVVAGGIWVLAYFGMKLMPDMTTVFDFIDSLSGTVIAAALLGLSLASLLGSYFISLHIMENKEY